MTGAPVVQVWLDDDTGTFPYEVSAYVNLSRGIGQDVGRGDEFDDTDAATFNLRLRNDDGRFSLGSVAYNCRPDQKLKMTVTKGAGTYTRMGRVQAWPTAWDGPLGNKATSVITVVDDQARLSRHTLGSMIEEEARVNGALAYWPMTEAAEATSAGARIGGVPPLSATGSGTPPVFAAADGPKFADGSMPLFVVAGAALISEMALGVVGSWTVSAFVSTTGSGSATTLLLLGKSTQFDTEDFRFGLDLSGRPRLAWNFGTTTATTAVNDGKVHHICLRVYPSGGSATAEIWVDGVLEVTSTGLILSVLNTLNGRFLQVGGSASGTDTAVGHVVVGSAAIDPVDLAAAGNTGFAGDTATVRLARIGSYVGAATASTASTICSGQQMGGVKVWDAMKAVGVAEGGRLYVNSTGTVVLASRLEGWTKATSTPAVATARTNIDHDDLTVQGDKQYLKNRVKGTGGTGAEQTVDNASSIARYDVYEDDLGAVPVVTDQEVYDRLTWLSNTYSDPKPRMNSVTIDLMAASPALVQAVLGVEVGARLTVASLPAQSPVPTADLIAEGWTETITHEAWSRTFNTSPATLQQPWTLEDPIFGQYDAYPLAY